MFPHDKTGVRHSHLTRCICHVMSNTILGTWLKQPFLGNGIANSMDGKGTCNHHTLCATACSAATVLISHSPCLTHPPPHMQVLVWSSQRVRISYQHHIIAHHYTAYLHALFWVHQLNRLCVAASNIVLSNHCILWLCDEVNTMAQLCLAAPRCTTLPEYCRHMINWQKQYGVGLHCLPPLRTMQQVATSSVTPPHQSQSI